MTHSESIRPASGPENLLELQGVAKAFYGKPALTDIAFTVDKGSLIVLMGPAGAGKTTTLRLIAGLEKPDAGRIHMLGRDMAGWEPRDRNVAMIFDNLALYPNKNGYQNIISPLVIRGESREVIQERVEEVARMLHISHILGRLPKTMSGGERQRIALGRALIRKPNLFLLDEPLSSLDAKLRISLRAELRRMQRDHGYTFILATPDFHEAMAIADTVIMLQRGRIVQSAPPQVMYDLPVDRETARFVGAPQINLVPAVHENGEIAFAGTRFPAPDHFRPLFPNGRPAFELGIRPEHLALASSGDAPLRARISDIESLGPQSVVSVLNDHAELRLTVNTRTAAGLSVGEAVGVDIVGTPKLLAFDPDTGRRLGI